jgi:hypothetical protein
MALKEKADTVPSKALVDLLNTQVWINVEDEKEERRTETTV